MTLCGSESDLISLTTHLVVVLEFLVLVGATSSKNHTAPSFQIRSGSNLAGLFLK